MYIYGCTHVEFAATFALFSVWAGGAGAALGYEAASVPSVGRGGLRGWEGAAQGCPRAGAGASVTPGPRRAGPGRTG